MPKGRAFMSDYHRLGDLAPRDEVARAIHAEREAGRGAFLDCRKAIGAHFPDHFPTVFEACQSAGVDPRVAPIPVAPAMHYHMGGVVTDLWATDVAGGLVGLRRERIDGRARRQQAGVELAAGGCGVCRAGGAAAEGRDADAGRRCAS